LKCVKKNGYGKAKSKHKDEPMVKEFDEIKKLFLLDIENIVQMDEVPPELIVNWEHTGINYIPVSSWIMEKVGAKRVDIIGKDDKRQLTTVLGCSLSGDFLPPQLIYQGKTTKCLPHYLFPNGWHITYTDNHWANGSTSRQYIINILLPYLRKKRAELKLLPNHRALVLFDNFKGECTPEMLKFLDENDISVVLIPPNCTDRLQPLDISVNKSVKEFLHKEFHSWSVVSAYV